MKSSDEEDNRKYMEDHKEGLRESLELFSNRRKPEREVWVVNELLNYLGVELLGEEVKASEDDPPDVRFRAAAFEVKEILDEDRRRTAEYKEALQKAEKVACPEELLEEYRPKTISIDEVYEKVLEASQKCLAKYAESVRCTLDLVFYVNLLDHSITGSRVSGDTTELERQRWRSVSVVTNECACVFCAANGAPFFLGSVVGVVKRIL